MKKRDPPMVAVFAGARVDENVSLGIRRHAGGLAQMEIRRQLQESRRRIERDLRRLRQ